MRESICALRRAPTGSADSGSFGAQLASSSGKGLGEANFLRSVRPMYLVRGWATWHLGAASAGICFAGQQGSEGTHNADKNVIGASKPKAQPRDFLDEALPAIVMKGADTLQKYPIASVTHEEDAPVTGAVLLQARLFLNTSSPPHVERTSLGGSHTFVINAPESNTRKMTVARTRNYEAYLNGVISFSGNSLD